MNKYFYMPKKTSCTEFSGIKNTDGNMVLDMDKMKDCMSYYFMKLYV